MKHIAQDVKFVGPKRNKKNVEYFMAYVRFDNDTFERSCYLEVPRDNYKGTQIKEWTMGQEVDVIFEDQGDFKNFKLPGKLDLLEERVAALEKMAGTAPLVEPTVPDEPYEEKRDDEVDINDIPF